MNNQNKKAFTIIEVVLVLAVAGLIFLVVFAAIPRLQASRRDNQRKRDAEIIAAAVIDYESNTGSLPSGPEVGNGVTAGTGVFSDYASGLSDPSGISYARVGNTADMTAVGQFKYSPSYGCNDTNTDIATSSPTRGDVIIQLERGTYCVNAR